MGTLHHAVYWLGVLNYSNCCWTSTMQFVFELILYCLGAGASSALLWLLDEHRDAW